MSHSRSKSSVWPAALTDTVSQTARGFRSALRLVGGLTVSLYAGSGLAELTPEQLAKLPPASTRPVDFVHQIQPLFEAACVKCHAKGKEKGEFSMETRAAFLKGGESGPGAIPGKSASSYVVELVAGLDPDSVMPKKGAKWTSEQIGLLRAWIDQGAVWPDGITFAKAPAQNLVPRKVPTPAGKGVNPVDGLLQAYYTVHGVTPAPVIEDAAFARRVYLDLIGLLPTAPQLEAFLRDASPDKRSRLVRALLGDRKSYADHWLSFWNDLLRNDYKGAGFIDGGRKQITGWLYTALVTNLPYDRFVAQLVNPTRASEGFTRGIIWRGNVNASMVPSMQAAQNISQVFLGINLKCASCHDSFVNDWTLADAYGLAAIYSDDPLELVHCDKPTGKMAAIRFLYPEVGALDASADKPARLKRLAEVITSPKNGRLPRTVVNRLWSRLLGRGLVEPLDDMEKPAWNADLLDWLAEDFVAHGYDLKRILEVICTSRAYQSATVAPLPEKDEFVFHGPLTRRMSAEQFSDAISELTGEWNKLPSSLEFDFGAGGLVGGLQMPKWVWTTESSVMELPAVPSPDPANPPASAPKPPAKAAAAAKPAGLRGKGLTAAARPAKKSAVTAPKITANAGADIPAKVEPPALDAHLPEAALQETDRHKVVFRKTFTLAAVPAEAYAALLASQRFDVQVNGKEAKPVLRDGFRNGRIVLLDLKPLLVAGLNVVTIDVSSHTEKAMNEPERKRYPASAIHLNAQSGLAFYLRCTVPGEKVVRQFATDSSWRVKRRPQGAWNTVAFDDSAWPLAQALPENATPIDEGPGLPPITRKDFANLPVDLGPQLSTAVSTVANAGGIRAALLAADPLQVALDRPNREVVIPARSEAATTMQGLELTNGATLDGRLKKASAKIAAQATQDPAGWLTKLYEAALSRKPTPAEAQIALEVLGAQPSDATVADLLWAVVNLPEFQLIN